MQPTVFTREVEWIQIPLLWQDSLSYTQMTVTQALAAKSFDLIANFPPWPEQPQNCAGQC